MRKPALLSSALIVAAIIASPAMAGDHHAARAAATDRTIATDAYPGYVVSGAYAGPAYYGANSCAPAPRVGAFATAPWTDMPACQPYSAGY